ncbi:hypothetical protein ACWEPC_15990 [Nonomuraea sp. NPDC004297]
MPLQHQRPYPGQAQGTLHTIEPAFITEPGWQQVTCELPDTMAYPVSLRRIFFNELDPDAGYVGTLILDELTAVVEN